MQTLFLLTSPHRIFYHVQNLDNIACKVTYVIQSHYFTVGRVCSSASGLQHELKRDECPLEAPNARYSIADVQIIRLALESLRHPRVVGNYEVHRTIQD
jgi:hypothetical protein